MSVETLILGRVVPSDNFGHQVAARIRKEQATMGRLLSGTLAAQWNATALALLADYIEARPSHDPRLNGLYAVSTHYGDVDSYVPGEAQRQLIALVGTTGHRPSSPDELLTELALAATEDALALGQRSAQSLNVEREKSRSLERQIAEIREAGAIAVGELEEVKQHAVELTAQAEGLKNENTSLGSLIDALTERAQQAERELGAVKPKAERWQKELRELRPKLRERNTELRAAQTRIAELEEKLDQCWEGKA